MSKSKKIIAIIIFILIVASIIGVISDKYIIKNYTIASSAQYKTDMAEANSQAEAEITLTPSTTGVHMGDTITITISAKCSNGLGGLDAVLEWDKDKIEFTNQADFDLSDIDNVTGEFKFSVLYNEDEQEADLATLEFKILDTVAVSEKLSIYLSNIELIDNNIDSIGVSDKSVVLNIVDHTFTNYKSNNDATCTKDGTKTAKCDRCAVTDTVTDQGSKLGHSFTTYKSNNDATCTKDGTKTAKCDRCAVTNTITDAGSAKGHSYENYKCTDCGIGAPRITITSNKHQISEQNITKISHKTTIKVLLQNLETTNTSEIKVLDKNGEVLAEDDFARTGATLVLKSEIETINLKLVIAGDATGDGKSDFKDMVAINKHRLSQKALEGNFLTAGDVTGDGKVDFKDIVKLNRFRLSKITELF